ncbi:MAG: hypothetical protein ACREM9_00935 [Gemmatimonadales bacterium]
MPRLWLAALGAAAVIGCGDDSSGGGPNQFFPDVAGTYVVEGVVDGVDPTKASLAGTVTIEQESLESSILGGSANLTLTDTTGTFALSDTELDEGSVTLAGVVEFTASNATASWTFTGERAGDVLEGQHTLTRGANSVSGDWSGER